MPLNDKMLNHRRDSPQQRHPRQSSVQKKDQNEKIGNALQRYENAMLKYQKPKPRPKRQISRERQQQSNFSSSDESIARNKSKSTSSIDTQSVNNILDEFEDLDYCRSSDLSDVGSISVTNFEEVMMDQQKRQQQQQQGRSKLTSAVQTKSIPTREKIQPMLKVNQQTQVRQRSRDRQKDCGSKVHHLVPSEDSSCRVSTMDNAIESGRSKMPEVLLRKGEVQKRVDEWLNQAHSQNFPRDKPLTRSNSSAEQKSQRRYRQDSRSRSIDEARNRLNGGASSSYDDLTRVNRKMLERNKPEKVNVGVNTSKGTYKEYLAVKSKINQSDYGSSVQSTVTLSRSGGDSSPASRIPQRGPLGSSSFRSRRVEGNIEEKGSAENRIINLTRTRCELDHRATVNSSKVAEVSTVTTSTTTTMTTSIIPCRRPSLKCFGNSADQNCATACSLVKEETRLPRGTGPAKGLLSADNLGDQGEPISPNKDGESRRPAAVASGLTSRPIATAGKTVEMACKSTEAPTRCAPGYLRDNASSKITSIESGIAIESRRRLQTSDNFRKDSKSIDQSRQEQSIYGLPVGARVRALQGQVESRSLRSRCYQIDGTSMEIRKPPVLPQKDHGASPSRDTASQDRTKVSTGASSSSFKPNNRVYTATSGLQQQLSEQNTAKSKIASCESVSSSRITRYVPSDHVERIYERSLQPQVIHADDLESILRPSLQVSPYGEKINVTRSDREPPPVKETSITLEDESSDRIGESRHEHLETIDEDDQKNEINLLCRYPEIGLKQCLKVKQNLPNGRWKESVDKKKDSSIYIKWDQQQVVFNEPARTFATFQSTSPCHSNVKSKVQSREIKESRGHEEIRQDSEEPVTFEDFAADYKNISREESDQLTIHSRENSNLSTATIPVDELESQRGSRLKTEEDSSRSRLQFGEKLENLAVQETAKDTDERGAVINEVLVKNLQFEQDLPENPSAEQTKVNYSVQQVNFRNVLCDDYKNEKLRDKKVYMTKEEMDHQRLIDMLKKRDYETLKTVSKNKNYFFILIPFFYLISDTIK